MDGMSDPSQAHGAECPCEGCQAIEWLVLIGVLEKRMIVGPHGPVWEARRRADLTEDQINQMINAGLGLA